MSHEEFKILLENGYVPREYLVSGALGFLLIYLFTNRLIDIFCDFLEQKIFLMKLKHFLKTYTGAYRVYEEVGEDGELELVADSESLSPDKKLLNRHVLDAVARDNAVDIYI